LPTPGGILAYPGLERRVEVVNQAPRHYRVRIEADFYRPLYRMNFDGIEFDAYPYNNTNPPQVVTKQAQTVELTPAANYPFSSHIRVLRGKVVDATDTPIVDAEVKRGNTERVLSGEQGAFALPLRWTANGVAVAIDAIDHRTGRTGTITI